MEAIQYNLFLVVAAPYLIAIITCGLLKEGKTKGNLRRLLESRWMTRGYVILFFAWFVVRNIIKM